jgi:hypothetical protein
MVRGVVRQFKLGGVYKCEVRIKDEEIGASFLIKVVGFDRIMLPWDTLQYRIFGNSFFGNPQAIKFFELIGGTPSCVRTGEMFYDIDAEVASVYPYGDSYDSIISSERVILKTGVLLFCATKLIVIARRAKERVKKRIKERVKKRMYDLIRDLDLYLDLVDLDLAVDRAAKSQRIE